MAIELRQVHPLFVREVGGIDLGQPVDAAAVRAIWEAIDRYAVLVFHDQHLDDVRLRDFARNFGELEIGRMAARGGKRRLTLPEIGDISNLDEEGRLRERDDRRRLDSLGNRIWHTDASYMPVPVVLGMLYAVAVPPASARSIRLHSSGWCGAIPARGARHSTYRRTPPTSSAGRFPRAASCSTTSTCMPPGPNLFTAINGGSATS